MKSQEIIEEIFNLRDENVEEWLNKRIEILEQIATETRQKLNPFASAVKRNGLKDDITANTEINGFLTRLTPLVIADKIMALWVIDLSAGISTSPLKLLHLSKVITMFSLNH